LYSIVQFLPSSHAFNLIKQTVGMANADWFALIGLSAAWLVGSWALLVFSYHYSKKTGRLVRVG